MARKDAMTAHLSSTPILSALAVTRKAFQKLAKTVLVAGIQA
jgi:hypothetical protein